MEAKSVLKYLLKKPMLRENDSHLEENKLPE